MADKFQYTQRSYTCACGSLLSGWAYSKTSAQAELEKALLEHRENCRLLLRQDEQSKEAEECQKTH